MLDMAANVNIKIMNEFKKYLNSNLCIINWSIYHLASKYKFSNLTLNIKALKN